MASDREGPKASVVLSCIGCRHQSFNARTGRAWCEANGRRHGPETAIATWPISPDWCPLHPGKLVAVPVPTAVDSVAGLSVKEALGRSHSLARDEGWNACRSEIIQRARALGQEVTDA